MDKPTAGLRKRQQIGRANRMMLLWIVGVSMIVGVSVVLMVFLVQKIWFGEKVINEKDRTVSVLDKNLKTVDGLKDNIRLLNTNENLKATRLDDSASPVQSVLDALPADANPTALASSLQTKLLTGVPGATLETLSVDSIVADSATTKTSGADGAASQISFTFSVSANANNSTALQQVLENLEKSIRPINVGSLGIEAQGNHIIMTVKGVSYYEPAKTVQTTNKVVKP